MKKTCRRELADSSPIDVREQNIEIKITGGECNGIAVDSELIFCQIHDTWSKRLLEGDR